jgi:hypothetical protein
LSVFNPDPRPHPGAAKLRRQALSQRAKQALDLPAAFRRVQMKISDDGLLERFIVHGSPPDSSFSSIRLTNNASGDFLNASSNSLPGLARAACRNALSGMGRDNPVKEQLIGLIEVGFEPFVHDTRQAGRGPARARRTPVPTSEGPSKRSAPS